MDYFFFAESRLINTGLVNSRNASLPTHALTHGNRISFIMIYRKWKI